MLSKNLIVSLFLSSIMSSAAVAYELPKCPVVNSLKDAQACFALVGEDMGSGNDENAVLVSTGFAVKKALIEVLREQDERADIVRVQKADYVGAIVQNNDEEVIYYYILNKGSDQVQQVGQDVNVADLIYDVCPEYNDGKKSSSKFGSVDFILLGMNPEKLIAGTVWLDDVVCQEE